MNRTGTTQRRQQQSILLPSTIIKNKWKVTNKIGQGSFGETYAATDMHTSEGVAVKVEKLDDKKMVLKQEVIVLKQLQACPYVVRYIHSGRQEHFNFLIMERLGENLAELRKQRSSGTFTMCTSLRLGLQMMEALEGIHKLGFIHRDVKPSNFVMGYKTNAKKRGRAYLIDFGLARKYRLQTGEVRPPRKNAGFRGTARYASINSHYKRELGRVDDLWSVFYAVIEFLKGSLPWMKMKDKEQIGQVKEKETNPDLVRDLPVEFLYFMEHLQKCGYADEPDYFYLKNLFQQIYDREGYTDEMPFDWNTQQIIAASPIPQNTQSIIDDPPVMSSYRGGNSASTSNMPESQLSSSIKLSNNSSGNIAHQQITRGYNSGENVDRPSRHSLPQPYVRDNPNVDSSKKGRKGKKANCKPCSIM